jgi:predicted DsbA family dithiol-disulfide isomerase
LEDLHRRYGIGVGEDDALRGRFAAAGLEYNRSQIVPNTQAALRLAELARGEGLHGELHIRLMDAYWSEATNIGDPEELRRIGIEVGLDAADVARVLDDPTAYADFVAASTNQAHSIGINAVPAFLLDRRLIVLGAQPIETFRRAFAQLA